MKATIQYIEKELHGYYPQTEIRGFVRLLLEFVCNMDYTSIIIRDNEKLDAQSKKQIEAIVQRLKKYEPVQYILGETEFYGLKIKVNPDVLIPRPETEELVQWIIAENQLDNPRIMDIGTGSGCIALALKNKIVDANVAGFDISEMAVKTAQLNARLNKLEVDFFVANMLHFNSEIKEKFDCIVSNPPYVRQSEKEKMQPNVLNFEPENALFVPDEKPLHFYKAIGKFALKHLRKTGKLFLEINEELGKETGKLFVDLGFKNTKLKTDINGKQRMLHCEWTK